MHKAHKELLDKLKNASEKVQSGGLYYHYKNSDQSYMVIKLAILEANDTICVIYEALYDDKLVFVRPLDSWLEKVEWNGKMTDRFTYIKSRLTGIELQ